MSEQVTLGFWWLGGLPLLVKCSSRARYAGFWRVAFLSLKVVKCSSRESDGECRRVEFLEFEGGGEVQSKKVTAA